MIALTAPATRTPTAYPNGRPRPLVWNANALTQGTATNTASDSAVTNFDVRPTLIAAGNPSYSRVWIVFFLVIVFVILERKGKL
jgi:hypothetical protein